MITADRNIKTVTISGTSENLELNELTTMEVDGGAYSFTPYITDINFVGINTSNATNGYMTFGRGFSFNKYYWIKNR